MKLLLVEDVESDARLFMASMQRIWPDVEIVWVRSLEQARGVTAEQAFDLAVLDLDLPATSGVETLRCFRSEHSDLPVVVLTGLDDPEFCRVVLREGAQDYLVKGEKALELIRRSIEYSIERREFQRRLRRRDEFLLQTRSREAVVQLAAGVAHEYNNHLAVLHAELESLADELGPDSPAIASIETGVRTVRQMADLTQRMQAVSAEQALVLAPVELRTFLAEFAEPLQTLLGDRWRLRIAAGDRPVEVLTDPDRLAECLRDLLLNARDSMPEGGPLGVRVLELPQHRTEGLVGLEVWDRGCGMERPQLQRACDPFYSTKDQQFGGIGLGLATARGFVEQCGGRLELESESGAGTRVTVCFPRAEASLSL